MEGSGEDNNSVLPPDFWMSQVNPHFSGHVGSAAPGDVRTSMHTSQAHEDTARKQPPLYDSYGVPAMHYKQSSAGRALPSVMQQPFTTSASNRSAWEFAAENLRSSPKDLTSQSYSLYTTNAATGKFSQSPNDFAPENLSQSRGAETAHNFSSQPLSSYSHSSKPKSVMETILSQSTSQSVREMPTHGVSQSSSTSDRSVWAHLYSLDPSISSYGVNPPINPITSYSQGKSLPYSHNDHTQGRDAFHPQQSLPISGGSVIQPQKPPLISSRDLMASSYFSTSSLPPESVSTSFASSGYSSDVIINTNKQQSQPRDYEEQLEGYSPVSPPTRDATPPFSSSATAQNGDLALKSDNFPLSSDFSYNTSSTSSGQIVHSEPSYLPISLDAPLDMSKAWAMPQPELETPGPASNETPISLPVRSDISSVDISKQTTQSSDLPVINQFGNNSQKVAPKKSNFYGRDASIFSLPENLVESRNIHLSDKVNAGSGSSDSRSEEKLTVSAVPPIDTDYNASQASTVSQSQNLVIPTNETFVSGFDSVEPNFADSFIDASTAPCSYEEEGNLQSVTNNLVHQTNKDNNEDSVSDFDEDIDYGDTDILLSQVKAVREKKQVTVSSKDLSVLREIPDQIDDSSEKQHPANPQTESLPNPEAVDTSIAFPNQPGLVRTGRGRAARGRKKRGAGAQRRPGRGRGKTQTQPVVGGLGQSGAFGGGSSEAGSVDGEQTGSGGVFPLPPPKPKPARGRKRKAPAANTSSPDDDASATRRSSNRRSKDNAMRLIELQAESVYSHPAKPVSEETKQPARARRKAAKAAMKNSFDESKFEEDYVAQTKDSSSDEMSDEKDVDYAVDDEDVAALEKDELLDVRLNQRKPVTEKKAGGLKISIKLGSDSSAEIVSGIDKSPPRKKRKTLKKKEGKSKFKSKAIIQDEDEEDQDEERKMIIPPASTNEESKKIEAESDKKIGDGDIITEPEEKPDIVNKHNSLMDKYFSSASTATLGHQPQKSGALKKDKKLKSNSAIKSKAVKSVKNASSKDTSVTTTSHNKESSSTPDKGVPKFRCGYCSNRYHDKHALLSHMEAHMAEMEEKEDKKSGGSSLKEPKKPTTAAPAKKLDSVPKKHSIPHQTIKKSEEAEEQGYHCGECGKNFPSKLKLLDHVRTHTAEKPFECNLCHKCFKERHQLSVHRKVHIQEGLIRCPICSKGFVNSADLTAHMESHPKRSKLGQSHLAQNKVIVAESAKKIGKLHHVSSDKESVTTKPKSFASALEPHSGKNKDQSTIVLRRNDVGASLPKDEATNPSKSISKSSSKLVTNVATKAVKDEPVKKQPHSDKTPDSKETKPDNKMKSVSETVSKPEVKKEKDSKNSSGECTCKECPECVTRFLQSFE